MTIIKTAYAEYLFKNVVGLSAGQMSNLINNNIRFIIDSVYEHFSLGKYVWKANGEESRNHTDIVPN